MAEQTSARVVVNAPAGDVMEVIADFAQYPAWATGVSVSDVLATFPDGMAQRVHFRLDVPPICDEYTLEYEWALPHHVRWHLVRGQLLKALNGRYALRPLTPETTEVTYWLSLDLHLPLIAALKRRGEQVLVESALLGLKKRAEAR